MKDRTECKFYRYEDGQGDCSPEFCVLLPWNYREGMCIDKYRQWKGAACPWVEQQAAEGEIQRPGMVMSAMAWQMRFDI